MFRAIRNKIHRRDAAVEEAGRVLDAAVNLRQTQEQLRDEERETVTQRIDRIYKDNFIAERMARRLAQGE